jgi:5-formaminoimidazole-4-carboxamide-1-beta-D-ribofuranosyl 5'-monophosphate synthetase
MPKTIKGEGILLSVEEYNSAEKREDGFFISIKPKIISEEESNLIEDLLVQNNSKPTICEKLRISESVFSSHINKKYLTKKITEVRAKIIEKRGLKVGTNAVPPPVKQD